jgi:hypothetical protein
MYPSSVPMFRICERVSNEVLPLAEERQARHHPLSRGARGLLRVGRVRENEAPRAALRPALARPCGAHHRQKVVFYLFNFILILILIFILYCIILLYNALFVPLKTYQWNTRSSPNWAVFWPALHYEAYTRPIHWPTCW